MDDVWIVESAEDLQKLTGPHTTKKRNTIIQLVDARIGGRPETSVWKRADTCSANIYHDKWKRDETFADVLKTVEARARLWHDTRAVRALAKASESLALASPTAVAELIKLLQRSPDQAIVLRSAIAILDRAGIETAAKSSSTNVVKGYAIVSPEDWDTEPDRDETGPDEVETDPSRDN